MTFEVHFYSEHAALLSVKEALLKYPSIDEYPQRYLAVGASCILSCHVALEAIVNTLIQRQARLTHWDSLRLLEKIDTIAELESKTIKWGEIPWQRIPALIRVRNWLAHSKRSYIGLSGLDDEWVDDELNKRPKIDPEHEFKEQSVRQYYNAVRSGAFALSNMVQLEEEYDFLETENYEPLVS